MHITAIKDVKWNLLNFPVIKINSSLLVIILINHILELYQYLKKITMENGYYYGKKMIFH